MCQDAKLYQIDLLSSKKRVSEREYWMKRRSQMKLDRENAALLAAGQQPTQTEFETAKETLRKQISDVLDNAASFEDFSDRLLQQYGITVKKSRGRLSYLPAGRKKFIRAKHLGDNYDKEAVLATLTANAEHKTKVQSKQDTIGKLIDIQSRMTEDKGIGYKRWITKHMLISFSPKYSISYVMGYLKGKSSLMIFDRHANLKYKYGNRHFWARGYFVDTVGKNKKKIQEYIKNQLQQDQIADQLSLKEFVDPFTGSKETKA